MVKVVLVAFDGNRIFESQLLLERSQIPSRLEKAHGEGITQDGGCHPLLRHTRSQAQPMEHLGD